MILATMRIGMVRITTSHNKVCECFTFCLLVSWLRQSLAVYLGGY
jgi:hypothetical protein